VKTVLIDEGRRCYCPVDSIGVPKESGKKVFPVAPVGFPPVTRGQLRRVGEKIAGLPGVEKVILFGSYARGNPTPDSDVHLLVIWNTRRPRTERWMAVSKLFSRRPFPRPRHPACPARRGVSREPVKHGKRPSGDSAGRHSWKV